MPFKSEAQRRYLWANEPEIARDWADTYGSRIQKENGGIMRLGFQNGKGVDYNDIQLMAKVEELRMKYPWKYGDDVTDEELIKLIKANEGRDKTSSSNWLERGTNWTKQLPGMAFSALSGIPGLGFLMSGLRSDPRDKYLGDPYSMQNYMGKYYGYGNQLRHGNITGQDQFGVNTRSMFGDYQGHYGNFMNDYLSGKIRKTKFNRNKFEFAKDVTGTKDTSPNITGTPLITQTSDYRDDRRDQPTRRGTFTGAHPDRPTKTPEQGGWHPGVRAEGGLIDFYKNGGFSG